MMRARITRTLPSEHVCLNDYPGDASLHETYQQFVMTKCLRSELEAMDFANFYFENSRKVTTQGPKVYQFDLRMDCDVETFNKLSMDGAAFDAAFGTVTECVDGAKAFEDEEHSAVAAVGGILNG